MVIRSANREEIRSISQLLEASGLPLAGYPEAAPYILCALIDAHVVGGAALEIHGQDALLRSVVVADPFKGTGIGGALVREALEAAGKLGLKDAYLLTETAAPFFSRLGFETVDRAAVPAPVRESVEFTTACPSSAQAMRRHLDPQS